MINKKTGNGLVLLVGTRKGVFILRADNKRQRWTADGPHFLGQIVNHVVLNPATGTMLAAARPGHLGHTVFRSTDMGKSWQEAKAPPAFPKQPDGNELVYGWSVKHVFWLSPGHATQPKTWFAGTSPHGLFRSDDDGVTWQSVDGFNLHPDRLMWLGDAQNTTPDGAVLHSINVDPFDAKHIYIGMSGGGVFESFDNGAHWKPLNRGCATPVPMPDPEWGGDPHCVRVHPTAKDVVYQQNHCGIYRLERSTNRWTRIGDNMPKAIGDIGFPMVLHPSDAKKCWVFPMDGTSVWPRVSIDGKPAVYHSSDAGESWQRQDKGLPAAQAWYTVKRQAMTADQHEKLGLYFGTTSGEVWASFDEGDNWQCLVLHLPHIYSLEAYSL